MNESGIVNLYCLSGITLCVFLNAARIETINSMKAIVFVWRFKMFPNVL